jgi:superoxide dismutase, Fe-Mn family
VIADILVPPAALVGPYVLPPLPYSYDALAPAIDAETLRLHHDKHHRAYVDGINAALAEYPQWQGLTIEEVLRRLPELPDEIRRTVRNQGGGHANHQFFWKTLTPVGRGQPGGELLASIVRDFGSFDRFKATFEAEAMKQFGSGWAFLVCRPNQDFKLEIVTLPNQDSVLSLTDPAPGLLICDLWEHAYYLGYKNRRADWLKAWWGIVHWDYVSERLDGIREGLHQL